MCDYQIKKTIQDYAKSRKAHEDIIKLDMEKQSSSELTESALPLDCKPSEKLKLL